MLQYWKNNYDPLPDNAPRILNDSTLAFTSNFKNWKNHYTVASGIEDEYVRCYASEPIFCQFRICAMGMEYSPGLKVF